MGLRQWARGAHPVVKRKVNWAGLLLLLLLASVLLTTQWATSAPSSRKVVEVVRAGNLLLAPLHNNNNNPDMAGDTRSHISDGLPPPTDLFNVALHQPVNLRGPIPALGDVSTVTDGYTSGTLAQGTSLLVSNVSVLEVVLQNEPCVEEVVVYLEGFEGRRHQAIELFFHRDDGSLVSTAKLTSSGPAFWWKEPTDGCLEVHSVTMQPAVEVRVTEVEVYAPWMPHIPRVRPDQQAHLIASYYLSENAVRNRELTRTLWRNLRNPYLHKVHLLVEDCTSLGINHPKIVASCFTRQPLYSDFFAYAQDSLPGETVVISNGDLVFMDTLRHVPGILETAERQFILLARWTTSDESNKCFNSRRTFDTYIFKGFHSNTTIAGTKFPMNRQGAEHFALYHLDLAGYRPLNYCAEVVAFHLHASRFRPWKKAASIKSPKFYSISPKTLPRPHPPILAVNTLSNMV